MEGQIKLTPFEYAITRPAPLSYQQMLQYAEYEGKEGDEGVSKLTEGKYFFKPIYRFNHNTYEEYCNMWDKEEYPVPMIQYLKNDNFAGVLNGLEEAIRVANELMRLIEKVENGEENFELSKIMELFLKYKPYSIIIDDIKGVTTVCDVTTDIDSKTLEKLSKAQRFFDKVGVKLNLFLQCQLKNKFNEYGELAELLTIDEITGKKPINTNELQERKKGFYLHKGRIIKTEEMEQYKAENGIILTLKERTEKDKRVFTGTKRISRTYTASNEPPCIIGQARLIYSLKDFMNMPSSCIVITPMIVREWKERLKNENILGIVTDEPNENDFLSEQNSDSIIGTQDATLYIENDDYVKIDGIQVERLSKEEALTEYIELLNRYQQIGDDNIKELSMLLKSKEWQSESIDEKILRIKKCLEQIRKKEIKDSSRDL